VVKSFMMGGRQGRRERVPGVSDREEFRGGDAEFHEKVKSELEDWVGDGASVVG
jgi:hypothetical protein